MHMSSLPHSVLNSIGSGHFGTVRKGVWFKDSPAVNVAVKTVKNTTEQERVKLLQEAAIMGQFAHNNVVRLLGVVTVGEPVCMYEIVCVPTKIWIDKGVNMMHITSQVLHLLTYYLHDSNVTVCTISFSLLQ